MSTTSITIPSLQPHLRFPSQEKSHRSRSRVGFVSLRPIYAADRVSSSSPSPVQVPQRTVSPPEPTKLPLRKIPGDYGPPMFGALKDRQDYFYNQGREEYLKSRMLRYESTVYRTNMPPGPFITSDSRVVVLLDGKSFPVLFDNSKVEKKDLFTGTYMPSTELTGGYRVLSYIDPSEPNHEKLKQLIFFLLKHRRDKIMPEFHSTFSELFETLEKDLAAAGKAEYNASGEQALSSLCSPPLFHLFIYASIFTQRPLQTLFLLHRHPPLVPDSRLSFPKRSYQARVLSSEELEFGSYILMAIVESILDLQVQDPPEEEFYSADLTWTKFGTVEHHDEVALIPYARVDAFIIGECTNIECPTRFHIERGRKRSRASLKEFKDDEYLEYRQYWCSFGPENYGEGGSILPSRRYRLNTRNRAARPQSMRGCTCHFVVKRLYARPSLALIIYNERRHVNKSGFVCHGPLDREAIGPGAKKIPYICNEIQQQTMSMIYLGIPEVNIVEKHLECLQRYCGTNAKANSLASQYVHKLGMIIKRSTHELDLDDQASISMWVERNKKSIFIHQDSSEENPFILGIQTEWQLQQMIRFGHRSLIAADSTFGIKRLKYPLCTLLVFDSRQHALPVAWIITRSFAKSDVSKWMKALLDRAHSVEPGWKVSGFLIDDAATEIDPIMDIFCCPVLFSLWRIRRSWLKNVVRKCSSIEVQREIFKRLGKLVYSIWDGIDTSVVLEDLTRDFVDQTAFMEYFKGCWVPKIEMWLSAMRAFPLASQEASGAIEAYHMKLKAKLFDDSHLGAFQRVDWLVHKLTTELHSTYWLDRYADESDSFQNVKEEYISSTSWHRALQIPDSSVTLDEENHLFAKVVSQKDTGVSHVVWNPGSEFSFCDCSWSMQGNLCKHVIKVNMVCENFPSYKPSLSFQSFEEILMNMWKLPMDDSVALDVSMAWTHQILDEVQKLVELNSSNDISSVVNKLPLKWASGKGRTSFRKPSSTVAFPSESNTVKKAMPKKNQKRKRLSSIR